MCYYNNLFFAVAGNVASKGIHKMFRTQLHVKLVDNPHASSAVQACKIEPREKPDESEEYEMNKLLISNIPDGVDGEFLKLFVYKQLHVREEEYNLTLRENKAEIMFNAHRTIDGEFIIILGATIVCGNFVV